MGRVIANFLSGRIGAAAVEYGALVVLLGLALVLALAAVGLGLEDAYVALNSILTSVSGTAAAAVAR